MNFENLLLTKQEGIATMTLNRPQALNALTSELVQEIFAALEDVERDETINVVILKGAGRAFCTGMDLKHYALGAGVGKDQIASYGPWQAIEELSKPVIAAVHGYAITGGYLLAVACDIVIASEEAKFADTHAKWGLIPYGGETQRLPMLVGVKKAKEMMFTSEMITAKEAERYGMVNKVVPLEHLEDEVMELAHKIARNSQQSVRTIKWLINRGVDMSMASGLRLESVTSMWGKANAQPDPDREQRLKALQEKG
ncbi:MAG: enoyl-CoA hydratase/isomerase family protein [Bacillota bacterium]